MSPSCATKQTRLRTPLAIFPTVSLGSRVNKGKRKGRVSTIPAPFAAASLLLHYYRPGARCSASPALRIASMPSSALSSAVVFTAVRCSGALAATSIAAAVLGSGAS
jgi:hypothetical protein